MDEFSCFKNDRKGITSFSFKCITKTIGLWMMEKKLEYPFQRLAKMGIIKSRFLLPVVTRVTSNLESSNSTAIHQNELRIPHSIFDIFLDAEQFLYSKITTPSSLLCFGFLIPD